MKAIIGACLPHLINPSDLADWLPSPDACAVLAEDLFENIFHNRNITSIVSEVATNFEEYPRAARQVRQFLGSFEVAPPVKRIQSQQHLGALLLKTRTNDVYDHMMQ